MHAVQLEIVWHCHMDETPPCAWRDDRAAEVQPLLQQLVQAMLGFAEAGPQ